ncbi:hypothetical protein GC1_00036 [Gluconobacter phage GC1]|uniref:Uncharacterized protein n=1 Tax=Gluconobacter phage GC1 TaxID=2047788 RepID=A0A2I5ARA0_9VIRU|nr:hypothetical protein FDJ08_gp36 [Gluconobacter phage GC1]ATS92604.1 hypothetical protein GC1_00036 [Gluconobacter phage GC1]
MDDTKYVFTKGNHSVLWHKYGFDVVEAKNGAGYVDSTYELSADGLSIAIFRCYFLEGAFLGPSNRDRTMKIISLIRDVAERLFSLGQRKAHEWWLEQ